jgi:hypothetical protein
VPVDQLSAIRDRFLPMLTFAQQEYGYRVPAGYPVIHDEVERGVVGIEIDPAHSVYVTTDGERLYADIAYRSTRYDTRSSASREKYAGQMVVDRRELPGDVSDQELRNLIGEVMSRFNQQQTILYITDD